MTPTLTPHGPGSYRVSWTENGKRRQRTFHNATDARQFYTVQRYINIPEPASAAPSLPQVVRRWAAKPTHSPRHTQRIISALDRLIEPYFDARRVTEIRPQHVHAWMTWLGEEHQLMASTVRTHFCLLRAALNWAVDTGALANNPCSRITPPRVPRRQRADALTRMPVHRRTPAGHHRAITPIVQLRRALASTDTAEDVAFLLAQLRLGDDD